MALLKYVQKLLDKQASVAEEVTALFAGDLNPVAPKAQKKVPVPEGCVASVCAVNKIVCVNCIML